MNMIAAIVRAYREKNYKLYEHGDYNVNLFGIRNRDAIHSDTFNDKLGVLYMKDWDWRIIIADGTTDPGIDSRTNPVNKQGAAILPCGQYLRAFKLGKHKGQYNALVQNVPLPLYRDNNKDSKLDFVDLQEPAMCGINFHRASAVKKSTKVGNWSAGCQVVADPNDFNKIMEVINKSAEIYGSQFTYTLFSSDDIHDL